MRIPVLFLVGTLLGSGSLIAQAQAPTSAPSKPSPAQSSSSAPRQGVPTTASTSSPTAAVMPAPPPVLPPPPPPSGVLRPALSDVQLALIKLHTDRWKRGSIRDEAADDINSIQREIQDSLPPLLKDADDAPAALSKTLPLERHVDALYDVLLRVLEAARFAAPDEQARQVRGALTTLGEARLQLSQRMADTATAQEKQLSDLRATVVKQAAFKCPAPPPEKPCPQPAAPKRAKKKPAAQISPQTQPNQPAGTKPSQPSTTKPNQPAGNNQQNQQKTPGK